MFQILSDWLRPKIGTRQFMVWVAALVGVLSGFLALVLKTLVHFVSANLPNLEQPTWVLLFPLLGIMLSVWFTKRFLNGNLERGVANILYEIARKSGMVKRHKLYSQVATSAMTVGLGGSAGLEAPIVVTGSAVGSNVAQAFGLVFRDRTTLLGCGAAAGIAAVFNSPIAGVMFAIEVLLTDVSTAIFMPLIVAAACGALCNKIILNEGALFYLTLSEKQQPFDYTNTPYYVLLSVFIAFGALYYAKMTHWVESFFKKIEKAYLKALVAGIFLAVLIYFFPSLFGEGYESIGHLSDRNFGQREINVVLLLGLVGFLKVIATSITLSSGGNGGNFAPSLFVGSHLGYFFSQIIQYLGIKDLPHINFAIVGMAGMISGVMYAPLTGIFLIAEVTGGYELIIPLMLVATLTFAIVKAIEPYSMETKKLAEQGNILTNDTDKNVLLLLQTSQLIETDIVTLHPNQTLRELTQAIAQSHRNIFAVVDNQNFLVGIIVLDKVRNLIFETEKYDTILLSDLMQLPPTTVHLQENMNEVMKKFEETEAWNLPVLDAERKYIGFISKSAIFSQYRTQLLRLNGEG